MKMTGMKKWMDWKERKVRGGREGLTEKRWDKKPSCRQYSQPYCLTHCRLGLSVVIS